jgi:nicotinate-nucleotide adenylyltransferase
MNEAMTGRRVAFFGGSFDPPHMGHLAVARAARAALELDTVLFAPVGAQPLKPGGAAASFEDRLEMTRLAIAGEPGFEISVADAPKASAAPNYTLETLLALRAELPAGGTLFCLMGADAFVGLKEWHRAAEIPFVAPLIVASRPGQPLDGLKAALPKGLTVEGSWDAVVTDSEVEIRTWRLCDAAGDTAPLYLLPGLHVDVSASGIRQQVRGIRKQVRADLGDPRAGSDLLAGAVAEYVRSHGLYL